MTLYKRLRVPGLIDQNSVSGISSYEDMMEVTDPLAYWKMSEQSGTVMFDSTSNNRNGVYSGATLGQPSIAPGLPDNSSVEFNASSTTNVAYSSWMDTAHISISLILKPISNSDKVFLARDLPTRCWLFYVDGSMNISFVIWNTSGSAVSVNTNYSSSAHHYVGTYDGSNVNLYVDGVLLDSVSHAGSIMTSTVPITFGYHSSIRKMTGSMQNVAVHDRALTLQEIQTLANKSGLG